MKIKLILIITVVCSLFFSNFSSAQNLTTLLSAIEKFEKELKTSINAESVKRSSEINTLKKEINLIKKSNGGGVHDDSKLDESINGLDTRIASLENSLTSLKKELYGEIEKSKEELKNSAETEDTKQLVLTVETLVGDLKTAIAKRNEASQVMAEQKIVEPSGPRISGFVDVSHYYDKNSKGNSAGLDQVELDFEKEISGKASLRADVEYVSDGAGGFAQDLEQGYIVYNPFSDRNFSVTFGKFNAPIGFELLDAPDMFQYSHALVFNLGLPTNLTGVMFSGQLNEKSDLCLYLVNGWDVNVDNNRDKTIGGRLGLSPTEKLNFGISGIYGSQNTNQAEKLKILDIDLTYNATDQLLFGGELNMGSEDIGGIKSDWNGFLTMFHYDFNDRFGITGRYDYFYDKVGSRTGMSQKMNAFTISPTFVLGDGFGGLFEIRYDNSDMEFFVDPDGKPIKQSITSAFELTYGF